MLNVSRLALALMLLIASSAFAQTESPNDICKRVTPALVAVQWTWAYEYGRMEFVGAGIVVRDDGLIMIPMQVADPGIADEQMVDFKIIIPSDATHDEQEIEAVFQGRDERGDVAFVKPKASDRKWQALKFEDVPVDVGDRLVSVGMFPRKGGYQTFCSTCIVGAILRGEVPPIIVTGGSFTATGGPVFNARGQAIGYINTQNSNYLLDATGEGYSKPFQPMSSWRLPLESPPVLFTHARELMQSLRDPPTPERPLNYPWLGATLTGIEKDVAEVFDLQNQAAIEIAEVVADAPLAKAGMKTGMKIVKFNGQPLTRGDSPDEVSDILGRQVQRLKAGDVVTLTLMSEKDKPLEDVKVTLENRPIRQNELPRSWFEDLGFSVRDLTFFDRYTRKQPNDLKGVLVGLTRAQSPAESAKLESEHIIQSINGTPVTGREQFSTDYKNFRAEKPTEAIILVVLKQDGQTQTIRIEPPQ
ncbi:MAG: PDZ domain-containing protein [Anaerolineae bacterium]|nr:PDZ domain-containing protein [Phycisphaerae bacterium]